MTWTYITRTEHAKLRLTIAQPLSREEWNELYASLTALEPVVVSKGTRIVEKLLGDLKQPQDELSATTQEATSHWNAPMPEQIPNVATFLGPLDRSVMGLTLGTGDKAEVTSSHREAHAGVMHLWAREEHGSDSYICGHGGCNAHVTVKMGL